jgi:hypothetical protein
MRGRLRTVALAAGALAVAGVGAGAVAATQGGGDSANDLAAAINERAGTSITGDQVQSAVKDLMKQRLDAEVAAGRLTQAQADEILQNAPDGLPLFPGGPGHHRVFGARGEILAPVATLLKLDEAALRERLQSGDTLAEVAKAQGVSKADLVAEIAKALKAAKPDGAPDLTDAQLTEMATSIADGTGPGPGHHGGPGGPGGMGGFGPPPGVPGGAADAQADPAPAIVG